MELICIDGSQYVALRQATAMTGRSYADLYQKIYRGKLECLRIGKAIFLEIDVVNNLVKEEKR